VGNTHVIPTVNAYKWSGGVTPVILNLSTGCSVTLLQVYLQEKETSVSIEYEVAWASESVWRRQKSLLLVGIRSPYRPAQLPTRYND
jgi:hypothetical protein